MIVCPENYLLNEAGNICELIEKPKLECPAGYTLSIDETQCIPRICCPVNFALNPMQNGCIPVDSAPACPDGQKLNACGTCEDHIACLTGEQPSADNTACEPIICPRGQVLNGNTCENIVC